MASKRTPTHTKPALVRGDAAFRLLFRDHPVPTWVYDPKSLAFLEVNDAAVRLYGHSRDEFLGMTIEQLRPPDEAGPTSVRSSARRAKSGATGEERHRLKDGRVIDVLVSSRPTEFRRRKAVLVAAEEIVARGRTAPSLRENEERLRLALSAAEQGLFDLDLQTGEATVSPEYATLLGYDPAQFHESNATWIERMHPDDRESVTSVFRDYVAGRRPDYRVEFRQRTKAGGWKWILSLGSVVERSPDGRPLRMLGTHTDITARKADEARILRLTQISAALSECNQAIVRCTREDDLFPLVCRAAVQLGGLKMAWIGLVDVASGQVRPVASYGDGTDYLEGIRISVNADDPFGRGPTGTSIREGQPFWCQDFQHDSATAAWHERGKAVGWNASASLPLFRNGVPIGSLTLYAGIVNAFDDDARKLLTEMTSDISYALDNFSRETERQRAEEALRKSEVRYRSLFENMRSGFAYCRVLYDDDGQPVDFVYLDANDALERLTGLGDLVGKSLSEVLPGPGDRHPELLEAYGRVASTGAPETFEFYFESRQQWLSISAYSPEKGHVAVLSDDVTERKRAEQVLRESVERFELASRATFNVIWDFDVRTNTLWRNRNYELFFGYRPEEIEPSLEWWASRVHPEDVERVSGSLATVLGSERESWSEQYRFRRNDGSYATVEDRAHIARDANGRAVRMLGAMQDISERQRAEADRRLQSLALNAAADSVIITDRDGTVEWSNPAFTALTGYSSEEAVGRNIRELVRSGAQDRVFYEQMWATILTGDSWRGEMTNRRKDGSLYVEEQTITSAKDARGTITHFVALSRDLTERRKLEAQLQQAQKMESIGRLAGGIAHDFNNLLSVINGTVELASMDLKAGDPLLTDLQEIRRAGELAASLTRQLLAFSRRQITKPEVVNLNTLLGDMRKMLLRVIGEDVDLVVEPANDTGNVRADPGQLEQVVMNLVVNARDAMPTGGTLTITTGNVELDAAYAATHPSVKPGPHVVLTFNDTGAGMDEATRLRVFEPFFTTKEQGKGTGLGLSTVYGIVKQSGGSIWVQSEPGLGTTFSIYLPRLNETAPPGRPVRAVAAARGTETILIVEDESALRYLATRILLSAGYTVLSASNGGEALLMLERHAGPVHLVLSDVVMPGLSGPDLAARLTQSHPELRVLFTSGYTDDIVVRHGVLDDTVHFLGKPYSMEELTRKVREVLDAPGGHATTG